MGTAIEGIIRRALFSDFPALWLIIEPIVRAGETYAIEPDIGADDMADYWLTRPEETWLFEAGNGEVLGTYYLKTNQPGPGSHVCNCGYMVAASAQGQGVATALCRHSMERARALGYEAMQYNFVAATNTGAVRLWQSLGFDIVGTLPGAFHHPAAGRVDAYVMYQWLRAPTL